MRTRKMSRLTQTAIGPKTVGFESIVQQALMGTEYQAKCRKCGRKFTVRTGGGFVFELLHCDQCGKERSITFEEIGEPYFRYARGLEEAGCAVVHSKGYDEYVRKHRPVAPLSEEESLLHK